MRKTECKSRAAKRRMNETYNEYENTILRINASGTHKYVYKTQQVLVEETHDKIHTHTHRTTDMLLLLSSSPLSTTNNGTFLRTFNTHLCVRLSKCFTECNGPYWIFFWFIVPNFKSLHCNMYAIFLAEKALGVSECEMAFEWESGAKYKNQ